VKRVGNLWNRIVSADNLILAAQRASRGKRMKSAALTFNSRLGDALITLRHELISGRYLPGRYTTFEVCDPKTRYISAAPFRDRVVHHAVYNIIGPIFESTFIHDTYANRCGFGTHKALRRFTSFLRQSTYVLQCDISKYFPSIDHEILKQKLRKKIKCRETLRLIDLIINKSNLQEPVNRYFPHDDLFSPFERRRGLPLGNLTSQFFANLFLSELDHFVKEDLRVRKYLRYVDDFALFSDDLDFLRDCAEKIKDFLELERLLLHPRKTRIVNTDGGASFVGFTIFSDRIRIRSENVRRARQRFHRLEKKYEAGIVDEKHVRQSLMSWIGHARHADSFRLRESMFGQLSFSRGGTKNGHDP